MNPHASRRHPLKMVCLPVPPLPQLKKSHGLLEFAATLTTAPALASVPAVEPVREQARFLYLAGQALRTEPAERVESQLPEQPLRG